VGEDSLPQPLEGIRVLEFGNFLAGPFAGMLLADMGADVIKIESPRGGDLTRNTPPHEAGESANFVRLNRNKRSVAIDLKRPEGAEFARALARGADLVLENFRPGVMDALGLGAEVLRAANPALVFVAVSGFGQTGPSRDRAAVNLIIEAASGSLSVTGEPDGIPMRPGVQTGDMFGALFATYAALAGLMGKVRHGQGRMADVSLVEASVAAAVWETSEYLATGRVPQPLGHRHRLTAPYQVFRTRDGAIAIGCPNDQAFRRILAVLDLPGLATDARFADYGLRKVNEDALLAVLEPVIAARHADELDQALAAHGVPCSRVKDFGHVFHDAHLAERGITVDVPHPLLGEVRMVRNPVLFDADGPAMRRPAPLLGEHTAALMKELGYSPETIARLEAAGVVRTLSAAGRS
jgi:crotonobetainyl-CoA:carnitine CoA-transferase CaiB-like acyl-CoA transferase